MARAKRGQPLGGAPLPRAVPVTAIRQARNLAGRRRSDRLFGYVGIAATIGSAVILPFIFGGFAAILCLAAGIGEELLFRAALLPLLGLWLSSALFAVAHLRTTQLAARPLQQFGYIVNTFLAGIALGLVFVHIGLLAAIGVHVIIDVVGLWAVQQLQYRRRAATAT